jgi:hypothetical protein
VLQYGAAAVAQFALVVHAATHTGGYADVLHAVVVPVQAEVSFCVHGTQVFDAMSQAGSAAVVQFVLLVHATQVFAVRAPAVVLHAGVLPVHAVVSPVVHWTQVFDVVSHAGLAAVVQLVLLVHWTQVFVAALQTAVPPVQLVVSPVVHSTQVSLVVSQTVRPRVCVEHSPLVVHWTQVPPLQNGVGSAHWPSPVQPVTTQVFVVVLQVPPSPQLVLVVHATQAFVVVLQYGVVPLQFPSPVHWTQVFVVVSQADVDPVQADVAPVMHCTQALVAVLHTGVVPEQFAVPTHCTH